MTNDDLVMEVYIYQGNEGEQVPKTVERLIVEEGVQELPDQLCCNCRRLREVTLSNGLIKLGDYAFYECVNLLEISICSTVKFIGFETFFECIRLAKVEFFECSASSPPHQLQTIVKGAFEYCTFLMRIKLPSSVTSVGTSAFASCEALIEANLSTTGVSEIPDVTFSNCLSLQTVSLPKTIEGIGCAAFQGCPELVTVVVPLGGGSKSIRIGEKSFMLCSRLANFALPKDSTAEQNSFAECDLLHKHYGEGSSRILAGLMGRFEDYPIHRMCYDHHLAINENNVQEFLQCIIADHQEEGSLVDEFGMTPFHVLFSTIAEPRLELLEVLLESSLPNYVVNWKDANGRRPLDYLMMSNNWTDGTTSILVQKTLQKWLIDPLARWGAMAWMEDMQSEVQAILGEVDNEQRTILCNEAYSTLEHYENVQATSILEMTLWKWKLAKSGWIRDGTKRPTLDREECRLVSGSNVVIPRIAILLDIPPRTSD